MCAPPRRGSRIELQSKQKAKDPDPLEDKPRVLLEVDQFFFYFWQIAYHITTTSVESMWNMISLLLNMFIVSINGP